MFFHEYEPKRIFAALKYAGLDYVEFWMETPWFWFRGAKTEELARLMQTFPDFSPLVVHAPIFDLNPCSLNPGVAELSGDYTCRTIAMMEELGGMDFYREQVAKRICYNVLFPAFHFFHHQSRAPHWPRWF
jgi:sugar phosphate isomerase/epimerase